MFSIFAVSGLAIDKPVIVRRDPFSFHHATSLAGKSTLDDGRLQHPVPALRRPIALIQKALAAKLEVRRNVLRKFPPKFARPLTRHPVLSPDPGSRGPLAW
jgi:hypothetical protein